MPQVLLWLRVRAWPLARIRLLHLSAESWPQRCWIPVCQTPLLGSATTRQADEDFT